MMGIGEPKPILFKRVRGVGRRGYFFDWGVCILFLIFREFCPGSFLIIVSDIRSLNYNAKRKNVVG